MTALPYLLSACFVLPQCFIMGAHLWQTKKAMDGLKRNDDLLGESNK